MPHRGGTGCRRNRRAATHAAMPTATRHAALAAEIAIAKNRHDTARAPSKAATPAAAVACMNRSGKFRRSDVQHLPDICLHEIDQKQLDDAWSESLVEDEFRQGRRIVEFPFLRNRRPCRRRRRWRGGHGGGGRIDGSRGGRRIGAGAVPCAVIVFPLKCVAQRRLE